MGNAWESAEIRGFSCWLAGVNGLPKTGFILWISL
jgi:hypothetical protein